MYKYEKTDWQKLPMRRSKLVGMNPAESAEKHSLFIGKVITLFGQPEYWSENNEDMCSWAVDGVNEAGEEICLEIYYGASGPAIGGDSEAESQKAAQELMELIKKTEPTDFHHESIYEDFGVKVEMGVKDGVPYYNSEMGEDMF